MKILLLSIMLVLVSRSYAESYSYGEVMMGPQVEVFVGESSWVGDSPILVRVGRHWDHGGWYVRTEFLHISNLLEGEPFHAAGDETELEMLGIGIGVKF